MISMNGQAVILTGGNAGYEPALTHRYAINFTHYPDGVGTWREDFNIAVAQAAPGGKSIEVGTITIGNRIIQFPMRRAVAPAASVALIIFGGRPMRAYDFFWKWMKKVYKDETDTIGAIGDVAEAVNVGGSAEIELMGPDGSNMAKAKLDLIWPHRFTVGNLDRSHDTNAAIAQVEFAVNEWEWVYGSGGAGGLGSSGGLSTGSL